MNDPVLDKILEIIKSTVKSGDIILFGSRARGDHTEKSDYDIAIKGISEAEYARVIEQLDENEVTLKKIDLLRYENLNVAYKTSVDKEGIVLYEQQ